MPDEIHRFRYAAGCRRAGRILILAFAGGIGVAMGVTSAAAQNWRAPFAQPDLQRWTTGLAQQGIQFEGRYLGEFAANPAGGQRQGSDYTGELAAGARLDLGRLIGLDGGSFDILFTDRQGKNLAQNTINNSISVQQIYGGGQTFQLTEFTYEQKLLNDRVNLLVGRTLLTNEFATSELYCMFQNNAVCGQPFITASDTGVSIYPVAGWGGRLQVWATRLFYIKFGAYQDVANLDPTSDHGFTWGLAGTSGFDLPVEVGLQETPADAAFPDRLDAGAFIDRSHYSGIANGPYYGRSLIYLQGQARLWQAEPGSARGLYGFAMGAVGMPASRQPLNFEINAGIVDEGPFAARPGDYAGFSISENHASAAELASVYSRRLALEANTQQHASNMIMFEANYAAQATPWLQIMPNFQYVVNPDGNGGVLAAPPDNLPNAVVFGLQFVIDMPKLFGIPGSNI